MKIQNLLEDLIDATIDRKRFNGTLNSKHDGKRSHKQLSNGSQASVKSDPNDPHMVKKHNTRVFPDKPRWEGDRTNDGYNEYIEYLITHDLMDNIHFPKVYNVKTIEDKRGGTIHTYTMEKLVETNDLSDEQVSAFIEHNIKEPVKTQYMNNMDFAIEDMCTKLEHCIYGYVDPTVVFLGGQLIKAIQILTKIYNDIHPTLDLSSFNVMWRRTPHGMVLVITDPFY